MFLRHVFQPAGDEFQKPLSDSKNSFLLVRYDVIFNAYFPNLLHKSIAFLAVGYYCIAYLSCRGVKVSDSAHDDSSQPYGRILIMINDCKEYFGYDYDLAKSGFLFLVNPLKLLFSFKENESMILGGKSSTLAAKGDFIFLYMGIFSM
jgi:hypothetical protein